MARQRRVGKPAAGALGRGRRSAASPAGEGTTRGRTTMRRSTTAPGSDIKGRLTGSFPDVVQALSLSRPPGEGPCWEERGKMGQLEIGQKNIYSGRIEFIFFYFIVFRPYSVD